MILPEFLSFGKIDDYDMLSQLGLAVSSGSDSFIAPNNPKPRYRYNWPNEDGEQVDLDSPVKKEARVFNITGWLLANNLAEFKTKYEFLKDLLYESGYKSITCKKWGVEVQAVLKSFPNFKAPEGVIFNGNEFMGVEIAIEFDEVFNVDTDFYLTDEEDNLILDTADFAITSQN